MTPKERETHLHYLAQVYYGQGLWNVSQETQLAEEIRDDFSEHFGPTTEEDYPYEKQQNER